jgi:5-methylcytosine-specific restriction protein A
MSKRIVRSPHKQGSITPAKVRAAVRAVSSKRSSKRGDPFYISKAWEAVRTTVLRRDRYICNHCQAKCLGKAKGMPSPNVDHIKPRRTHPELELDPHNCRTLCHSCHSKVTKADQLDRPAIGADGYPLEAL